LEGVLDVIYNPARTKLLLDAEKRGLVAMNGLWMLVAQAKEASEWFTGNAISDQVIEPIYSKLRRKMENIILIGMPGCGKSTVARQLGAMLGRKTVDADQEIEKAAGKTIPEIFAQDGEESFRQLETQVLAELGKCSGLIIATGGGCVTREENYPLLHQNGTIFWLQREISQLPTDGRPLSQATRLTEMYRIREPMYRRFADHIIDNNGDPQAAASEILNILESK
jgi:shikimate dehydrogenase